MSAIVNVFKQHHNSAHNSSHHAVCHLTAAELVRTFLWPSWPLLLVTGKVRMCADLLMSGCLGLVGFGFSTVRV